MGSLEGVTSKFNSATSILGSQPAAQKGETSSVRHLKQSWLIFEGRNNLFYTLLVFFKYYQVVSGDYLDNLHLGGSVGLLPILKGLAADNDEQQEGEGILKQ
jgi:hypothetical protein